MDRATWDDAPSRNLLRAENLALVQKEFAGSGVIFGWHYYYAGGGSGDVFCFGDFESYRDEIIRSRPGDHFTVYSLSKLRNRAFARIGNATSNQHILPGSHFAEVNRVLSAGKEILFVWRHIAPEGRVECAAGALWDLTEEEFAESLGLARGRPGELLFFLQEMLDEDTAGLPIESVSPGARVRIHAVVDGKRPDEAGLTPASGTY